MRFASMCTLGLLGTTAGLTIGCVDPVGAATPVAFYAVDLTLPEATTEALFGESSRFVVKATTTDDELGEVGSFCKSAGAPAVLLGMSGEAVEVSGDTHVIVHAGASDCGQDLTFRVEVWSVDEAADCPPEEQYGAVSGEVPLRVHEASISEDEQYCESTISAKYKSLPLTKEIERKDLVEITLD